MSWFSKNYDKTLLGAGIAAALGLAYLGWSKFDSLSSDFAKNPPKVGENKTEVPGADLIPKAQQSMKLDRIWKQAPDGDRPVDLFTGIDLFIKSSAPDKPIDLRNDAEVHPPIKNTWWLDHRLDPGFGDSPNRDPDSDGFSNLDEYNAKTDPNDGKSHPELIAKLMFLKVETLTWVVRPGYGSDGKFPFSYEDSARKINKLPAGEMVGPNDLFFLKGPAAVERFKLLGSEVRKEMNKATGVEKEVTWARIEDQRPNKKGKVYEIPAPLSEDRKLEHAKFDHTAVFSLEALGLSGKEFKVEENTSFALPPTAATKDYLAKEVTPDSVIVEYSAPDGTKKTVDIKKGGMPLAPRAID
jgi:hypothetical protein